MLNSPPGSRPPPLWKFDTKFGAVEHRRALQGKNNAIFYFEGRLSQSPVEDLNRTR